MYPPNGIRQFTGQIPFILRNPKVYSRNLGLPYRRDRKVLSICDMTLINKPGQTTRCHPSSLLQHINYMSQTTKPLDFQLTTTVGRNIASCWIGSKQLYSERINLVQSVSTRFLHLSRIICDREPSSKVEETVKAIEENLKEKQQNVIVPPPKRSLWKKIEDELLHYYHGFRLLFIDIKISAQMIWRILNGKTLSRREHKQLIRTTSDVFRLVPFSVFIIVPFMELLLPVFLKFFPGMLPSTFQTKNDRETKMKAELKVKLEMAKFLQQTLDEMAPQAKGRSSQDAKDFAQFIEKIRTGNAHVTNEEIIKFSKLFEDEITLDSLSRPQLVALCRVLEIPAIGNTTFLRFQLRLKLRNLVADDKVIELEGVKALNIQELQVACKQRGMRAIGIPEDKLRHQLSQWLQLSLHEKVPPSLLLLSRAMFLAEDLPAPDQLKTTLSALPDAAALQTKGAIGEREGKVDNKTRIEILKEEQRKIAEERQEEYLEKKKKAPVVEKTDTEVVPTPTTKKEVSEEQDYVAPQPVRPEPVESEMVPPLSTLLGPNDSSKVFDTVAETPSGILIRNVSTVGTDNREDQVTKHDLEAIENAIDTLGVVKKKHYIEKEELDDLKEEMADYKEDLQDLETVVGKTGGETKETKGARRLFTKLNSMISHLDSVVNNLEKQESILKAEIKATDKVEDSKKIQLVETEELISEIKRIQKITDPLKIKRIAEILESLDDDMDGKVEVDDVLKMIELIERDNVSLSAQQICEIVNILGKEELLEKLEDTKQKERSKPPSNPLSGGGEK